MFSKSEIRNSFIIHLITVVVLLISTDLRAHFNTDRN